MFLRNAWYCASWSHEVGRHPLGRTIMNEKIVLYRKQDGGIVALSGICPHRFAPLHHGNVQGDAIACRYHGLQFGEGGACVVNPHDERIASNIRVRAYPVVERHGAAWIWMGDNAAAEPSTIPDFSVHEDPGYRTFYELLPVKGNYQLVCDNLLDLSHTQFLHHMLTQTDGDERTVDLKQEGETITSIGVSRNFRRDPFAAALWPDGPERIDSYFDLRWDAPGNMLLHISATPVGGGKGFTVYGAQLATPESETTTHYFWSFARDFRRDEDALDEGIRDRKSVV